MLIGLNQIVLHIVFIADLFLVVHLDTKIECI